MINLLIKHFVKNHTDTKNPEVRENYGKLAGLVGIISNVLLCSFKIGVGIVFNSISILADGVNNLADASGSLVTLIGFRLAGKEPDKEHPYGHGRMEYLTGLMISVMIVAIGIELLRTSIEKTIHPEPLEFNYLMVSVLVVSICMKIWQTRFNVTIGNVINSSTLKATGTDSRNDVIATSSVLIALLIGKWSSYPLDGPMGILVALFIIYSGWSLINETVAPLLGKAPDPQQVQALKEKVESFDGVLGTHDLMIHDYGPGRSFASVHVEVDASADLMDSHDMVDNIEREVYKCMGVVLTAHMDPMDLKDPLTIKVREQLQEISSDMDDIIGVHDVRAISGVTHHNIIFDVTICRECQLTDKQVISKFRERLSAYNPMYRIIITVDKSYE